MKAVVTGGQLKIDPVGLMLVALQRATMEALERAARDAPVEPGVYFMLDDRRELIYIGSATKLRRRLQQHVKASSNAATHRDSARGERVADVAWELAASGEEAADREADLVVALMPALNAALAAGGRWTFIDVAFEDGTLTVSLTSDAEAPVIGRRFGCFPHLGPGSAARRSSCCTEGLPALLRLVWAAAVDDDRARHPPAIAGRSLRKRVTISAPSDARAGLTRVFSGTSAAVLNRLATAAATRRPQYMHPGLRSDADRAMAFFVHGPRLLRDLTRRHHLGNRPIEADEIRAALSSEVTAVTGEFHLTSQPSGRVTKLIGQRRARAIAARSAGREGGVSLA